eukprot:TRINITY_DN25234_c0_g1_i2.p1 TRINITY_DN25234_c0_g1~~TRINITY_DN25234_c0_g1_i2.p1  ORF type:complete len:212 (-),score=35.72 TRINITY_DN25234_c0_g1_i2:81-716(-)
MFEWTNVIISFRMRNLTLPYPWQGSKELIAWQSSGETPCKIKVVEDVKIWSSTWATPKEGSSCIDQALNYGLQVLQDNGIVDMLISKHLGRRKTCAEPTLRPSGSADITDLFGIVTLHVVFGVLCLVAAFIKRRPHRFHPSLHPKGTLTFVEEPKEAVELAAEESETSRKEPEDGEEFVIIRHGDAETVGRILISDRTSATGLRSKFTASL